MIDTQNDASAAVRSFSLESLVSGARADIAGMMALRGAFGDAIVDIVHAELPHLEQTLALEAAREQLSPHDYVRWLLKTVEDHFGGSTVMLPSDTYESRAASYLVTLIDPHHEDEGRLSLRRMLEAACEQILEDRLNAAR